jgi:Arc/MetJ family transcription regulator
MPTNLAIDDKLLNEFVRIGKFKTKREAVNYALSAMVRAIKRKGILSLAGKIDFVPNYNYKNLRKQR